MNNWFLQPEYQLHDAVEAMMLFWTPDITTHLNCWLNSATEQVVRCEVAPWNGTQSPEFERWISRGGTRMCISLAICDQQIDHIIGVVWSLVSPDQKLVREFIENNSQFRRDELIRQINSEIQPDLSIYDCIDLLSKLNVEAVLCLRIVDSVPNYLLAWLGYIQQCTSFKIIILYSKNAPSLNRLKSFPCIQLPTLSKSDVIESCCNAVDELTGKRMQCSELDAAFSYSESLNEFISIIQSSILYQCSVDHCFWHMVHPISTSKCETQL
tara:strand:+ start:3177 stop:3983 length:807 start_codon:yes stop_codon:yes gene_type:complete